ncbi:hybrid sensor histidine kinase/response regulator [Pseudomonas rubra]|uniref:histidine kinase n=1 Tax=Pseudomonas rubra TaxID=2942627 RepID=A0ABT5PAE2_9PSED|nr:PAS domain-containing sensor histidine kinase [Pseudomonas rubra]MDD1015157.1 PAS domain S-box protein [Pseudomonas rubra]MDD1037736.1 PAS domain S-box protein [Pseudomonas rubra]MDD1157344.1 PAS domain S-box protein [Pseudomonas rubra]
MSVKVRNHDWGSTALGPLHLWPAPLRIAVDMLLASRFPGCLVWGPQMVTIYNDAFRPILGAKPEALGRGFDEVWSEAWDSIGGLVFRTLAGEAIFIENFPLLINRNGSMEQTYFTFCYSPIRDERGAVAGFLDTVIETTASVEAEQQWRHLADTFERQVQERTADRNQFWQMSSDIMLTVLPDLRISTVNPAWNQVLGWSQEEVLGTSVMGLIHADDLQEVESIIERLRAGQASDNRVSRLRHKDGHYRWFNWVAAPSELGFTAVGNDITEEREREEALSHAEELLRQSQKMEAIGQLSGGMAHDFNNLLTGISGSIELLERRIAQGHFDNLQVYLDAARGAAKRAAMLTHRLLAFSRRQALDPKPVCVNQLVLDIENLVQQTLGAHIDLQVKVEPAPWWVLIDANQLENALINLCLNARDAMGAGGCLRITTSNERHELAQEGADGLVAGDYFSLQVQDNGHGMSADVVARAFDPFFTTKPVGQGTGLGLSMVYGFVRQSGGRVWIDSSPGEGARVKILLPRFLGELPQSLADEPVRKTFARANGERILLVDDERTLRLLLKEALEEEGFEVFEAGDANAALQQYRQLGSIDLLITDIGLPGGFSGRQVANALRMQQPQQKVLFITGYAEQAVTEQEVFEPGMALMTKPFGLDALVQQVHEMLAPA